MGDAADDLVEYLSDPDRPFRIWNGLHRSVEGFRRGNQIVKVFVDEANDYRGSVWDMNSKAKKKWDEADRLEKRAIELRNQAAEEEARVAIFGEEPELGTVFRFEKVWETNQAPFRSYRNTYSPVKYLYAATRTKIGWVLSAREETRPMTYPELIDFIGDSPCEMARKWKTIQ